MTEPMIDIQSREAIVIDAQVLARGKKGSILVEFKDGFRVITSRYAVRKADQ